MIWGNEPDCRSMLYIRKQDLDKLISREFTQKSFSIGTLDWIPPTLLFSETILIDIQLEELLFPRKSKLTGSGRG